MNLKKVIITYHNSKGTRRKGICWIPTEGENPMTEILTDLGLLAEDYKVECLPLLN